MTSNHRKSYLNCTTGNSDVRSKGKRQIPEDEMDIREWYVRLQRQGE